MLYINIFDALLLNGQFYNTVVKFQLSFAAFVGAD